MGTQSVHISSSFKNKGKTPGLLHSGIHSALPPFGKRMASCCIFAKHGCPNVFSVVMMMMMTITMTMAMAMTMVQKRMRIGNDRNKDDEDEKDDVSMIQGW